MPVQYCEMLLESGLILLQINFQVEGCPADYPISWEEHEYYITAPHEVLDTQANYTYIECEEYCFSDPQCSGFDFQTVHGACGIVSGMQTYLEHTNINDTFSYLKKGRCITPSDITKSILLLHLSAEIVDLLCFTNDFMWQVSKLLYFTLHDTHVTADWRFFF